MEILQERQFEEAGSCPYLAARTKRSEYFLAEGLSGAEIDALLAAGWRKFGIYYFRPACPECRACTPLRVPVADFRPSRSQRRTLRRSQVLRCDFGPLRFDARVLEIYRSHSRERFGQEVDLEELLCHFYLASCPVLQNDLYLGDELIGVGFLDRGEKSLSSVYFCFDPRHAHLQPGTFAALAEIAYARREGLLHYHLGYFVPGCGSMAYKDHFRPRQYLEWPSGRWRAVTSPPAPLSAPAGEERCDR